MSLIDEGGPRSVRMAHLASVGSHAINGVAALHTDLLKRFVLRDFQEMWPGKIRNVTNGVTPRRFVALINPGLAAPGDRGASGTAGSRTSTSSGGSSRWSRTPASGRTGGGSRAANKEALAAEIEERAGRRPSTPPASSTCRSSGSTSTSGST